MLSTVFNSQTVFILDNAWNGKSDFKLDGSIARAETESLTRRSARRPYSESILCHCQFPVTIANAEVRAVIGLLRSLNTQPVVIPFWPAVCYWPERNDPGISGGLRLAFKKDWSEYSLYASTDAEPGWPGALDLFTPALMGFIKPTQPKMLNPDAAVWDIDFQESSPAAYALRFTDVLQDVAGVAITDTAGNDILGF